MKYIFFLFFASFFTFSFGQKYQFNTESKFFLNEYTGNGELINGSESKVKTTLTLYLDNNLIFIQRDVYENEKYSNSRVNQFNIIEVIERDDSYLFKTADLLYRQYIEIILGKDTTYLTVSTKCDSKNCSEFNAYY